MTIEKLQNNMYAAMKQKDATITEVLRNAIAAVKKVAIDRQLEISESLVDEILIKEQKIIQEMIDTCPSNRTDLLDEYNAKMAIIRQYAPQLLTDPEEIATIVAEVISTIGAANKGQVMKALAAYKGKLDMSIAAKVVDGTLTKKAQTSL